MSENVLVKINLSYQKNIAPIFVEKCMNCHGDQKKLPWYYALPLVKGMMNNDIKEAKKHLHIQSGFPFKGHGSPELDLEAILNVVNKNKMPPLHYKFVHWSSGITDNEKKAVGTWVQQSQELLGK